ncbi:hypothetical protein [Streptomyces sp. NPDC003023]|uniref:hypothetical protein n=1 Tax=Streptomyces sp. NPDC003023 TaxID=3364675 RepID=UPI0036A99297
MAALIPTPVAVLAAAAAYAAGRAQARGAHRGPVDAVRRQHQRDAYAAFLEAANTYASETARDCLGQAQQEVSDTGDGTYGERVRQRQLELRWQAASGIEGVRRTLPVVLLEGPQHVADHAQAVAEAVYMVRFQGHLYASPATEAFSAARRLNEAAAGLDRAIAAFTVVARNYLNAEQNGT